jgi:U4/U6.U5 tri-snRNP component SNU23
MPSNNLPYKQAANVERRTWDKEKYEARAKARIEAEENKSHSSSQLHHQQEDELAQSGQKRSLAETILGDENGYDQKEEFQPAEKGRAGPMNSQRAFLKARKTKIDLESKVGSSEIINPEEAAKSSIQITDGVSKVGGSGGVGWHCKVCDCYLKDSLTYLDHINGKKHQRNLGYSMRTEKSTTEEVSSKMQQLVEDRKKKEEKLKKESMMLKEDDDGVNEFEELVKKKDEEILKRKEERARRREERKKKAREEKTNVNGQPTENHEEGEDEEGDDETNNGLDPDMAKLMGFSNFG